MATRHWITWSYKRMRDELNFRLHRVHLPHAAIARCPIHLPIGLTALGDGLQSHDRRWWLQAALGSMLLKVSHTLHARFRSALFDELITMYWRYFMIRVQTCITI